jgi:hypothetical protein
METKFTLDEFVALMNRAESTVYQFSGTGLLKHDIRRELTHLYLFLNWLDIYGKDVLMDYLKHAEYLAEGDK